MYQTHSRVNEDRQQSRQHQQHHQQREPVIHYSDSILNTKWSSPDRPYSQNELNFLEEKLYKDLHLVDLAVSHTSCGHTYRIKKNGARYKKISEEGQSPVNLGNCSMCWKVHKTHRNLRQSMNEFIDLHDEDIKKVDGRKSFFSYQVKKIFYTWLYNEMYE